MKALLLFIFLFSGNLCVKQSNIYIVRFKNCENLVVPGDIMLGKQKIAVLRKVHSMTKYGCIGEIILNNGIILNSAMRFHYKQVFIGDNFIEVTVDSLRLSSAKKLAIRDTILIN